MKIRGKRLLFLLILNIGTSGCLPKSQPNKHESLGSNTLMIAENTPTIVQSKTNEELKKYKELINDEGWHIPLPEKAQKNSKFVNHLKTKTGKSVNVVTTTLVNLGDYRYSIGSLSEEQKRDYPNVELKLSALKVRHIGNNIYEYVIFANRTEFDANLNANKPKGQIVAYKIKDKDGDGKFETFYPGDSDNLVPEWVLR